VNVISQRTRVAPSDHAYQRGIIGNRQKSVNSLTFPVANNYTAKSLYQYSAINNPQSSVINHSYDLDGTATTTYKYDAWNSIADYERGTGVSPVLTLKKTRLWGTDLSGTPQGAGGVSGLLSESHISNPQSPIYYPTYDGNGNISEYLTATGTIAAHFEYDPFGNTVVNTDTANLFTYRFSTKPRDQETGLSYYGYRYYDLVSGRWPSRDPIEEKGGLNLYGFVENNGANRWDKLGLVAIVPSSNCSTVGESVDSEVEVDNHENRNNPTPVEYTFELSSEASCKEDSPFRSLTSVTSYSIGVITETTTFADGSTSITTSDLSGRVTNVSGTAVIAKNITYPLHTLNGGGEATFTQAYETDHAKRTVLFAALLLDSTLPSR
jgi:RHS repeat-associated protein